MVTNAVEPYGTPDTSSFKRELCSQPRVKAETLRYLGYGTSLPSEEEERELVSALEELEEAILPRVCTREFSLLTAKDQSLWLGSPEGAFLCPLPGRDLAEHLKGCRKVLILGATLGSGPDRLLQRYGLLKVSRAAILQAAAAAVLEELCDRTEEALTKDYRSQGLSLRPRFSPGYGDLPLTFQKELFRLLPLSKTIGLTLTDSLMMSPTKSVTALVGLSETPAPCPKHRCEHCGKTDCPYRRS